LLKSRHKLTLNPLTKHPKPTKLNPSKKGTKRTYV